jgi:hypothetical protein
VTSAILAKAKANKWLPELLVKAEEMLCTLAAMEKGPVSVAAQ